MGVQSTLITLLLTFTVSVNFSLARNPPVIGVLTQPKSSLNRDSFPTEQYVLEANEDFIERSGAVAVYIPYDASDDDLYELLDSINGVHFTGGGLDLINPVTGEEHKYYQTSKKIYNYAKDQKDIHNTHFPLTGICQGHELISLLGANDKKDLLQNVPAVNVQRKQHWLYQDLSDSRLFGGFSKDLIAQMSEQEIQFHFHDLGVTVTDFYNTNLHNDYEILSFDIADNLHYVTSMEARNYPFYSMMFHPEYQWMTFTSEKTFNTVKNELTREVVDTISNFLHQEALKNDHFFANNDVLERYLISNKQKAEYRLNSQFTVLAYSI